MLVQLGNELVANAAKQSAKQSGRVYTLDKQSKFVKSVGLILVFTYLFPTYRLIFIGFNRVQHLTTASTRPETEWSNSPSRTPYLALLHFYLCASLASGGLSRANDTIQY